MALVAILLLVFFGLLFYFLYYLTHKNTSRLVVASLITSLIFIFLLVFLLYESLSQLNKIEDYSKLGPFGDYIGGLVNPLISVFAVVAAGFAFYAQYEANKQVQEQFKMQQFESQFFEMLSLHKENVNEMKISGYDVSTSISYNSEGAITDITKTQIEKTTDGRKVFVTMSKELIACYELCELYNIHHNFDKQHLLELAYNIFFFGSASNISGHPSIDPVFVQMIKDQLKIIRNNHKVSLGEINELLGLNGKTIKLHFKYAPFTGHESRLGHYYRHLYNTVKYVVQNEKDNLINYKQARNYLKILRSQMSNHEQLMLYYNIVIGYGQDWVNYEYVTKYRMLHNLPVDKVKYAKNPRDFFKKYIEEIKNTEDPLFEWGD
jgi:hypothetical protein